MNIVLDTNVFVSSLLFRGPASEVHAAWTAGRFVPLVSKMALEEYTRVLACTKLRLSEAEIGGLLRNELLRYAEPVVVSSRIDAVKDDPADNRFLELAIDGRADLVVTGDRHLLDLGSWRGTPIVGVRGFLNRLD